MDCLGENGGTAGGTVEKKLGKGKTILRPSEERAMSLPLWKKAFPFSAILLPLVHNLFSSIISLFITESRIKSIMH
jgi:hypothetical protein